MEMNERVWHLVKGELHFPLLGAGVRKAAERHGRSLKSFLALTRKELLTVPRLFLYLRHEANNTDLTEIRAPDTYSKCPAQGRHIIIIIKSI